MTKFLLLPCLLAAACAPAVVQGVKIAFVGDTGMEDEFENGYGDRTMEMIEDQEVDLVVDVGDFDYWGRCTETYETTDSVKIDSLTGEDVELPEKSTLKRIKWQDGRHGSVEGWEIGIQPSFGESPIAASKRLTLDGNLFHRHVISNKAWKEIEDDLKLQRGERNCDGEPWDGPWEWNQFLRGHDFDFLGASGNAEVKEAPLYGSAEIWASHQKHMHELYMERIYNRNRGACHGYSDQTEPGTVDEYGERFSCYYNNNDGKEDFQFLFLGWWQGSNERTDNGSKENRQNTIEFIEREFSDERSQNVRWRFCIQHMTSAKLSSGDQNRDSMVLARITDTCRKHGAIIISGHHHIYSRTYMLKSVGNDQGEDPIRVSDRSNKLYVQEGITISITAGMGGYDGACNGKYWNATWMDKCISRPSDHRGAVIAEFDEQDTRIGYFKYMNSLKDGEIVDEFQIQSKLPGSKSKAPTSSPSKRIPSREPTESPSPEPTHEPTHKPTEEANPTRKPSAEPSAPTLSPEPTLAPTLEPTHKPSRKPKPQEAKPTRLLPTEECVTALDLLCSIGDFSKFCALIGEFNLGDWFSPGADNHSLTIFAPTNLAFEDLDGAFDSLDTTQAVHVLLYHVTAADDGTAIAFEDFECDQELEMANGATATLKCTKDRKFVIGPRQNPKRQPRIIVPNIEVCDGGMVHVVNNVVWPYVFL